MRQLVSGILVLVSAVSSAQLTTEELSQIDSLKAVIESNPHDTVVIKTWKAWDDIIYVSDPEMDFELNVKIESLCAENLQQNISHEEREFYQLYRGNALNILGITSELKGEYAIAIEYYEASMAIMDEIDNKRGVANVLNNIGNIYRDQAKYSDALDYYTRSLIIEKELKDEHGIAMSLNNIGIIHMNLGDYAVAINYFTQSLTIRETTDDKQGTAAVLNNIGNIYMDQKDYPTALEYYNRSLVIEDEIGNQNGAISTLNNIGNIYKNIGDYANAIDCFNRSLIISQEIGDRQVNAFARSNLGTIYLVLNEYDAALQYLEQSLHMGEEIGDKRITAIALTNIGIIYRQQGHHTEAIDVCERALKAAQEIGAILEIRNASLALFQAYLVVEDYKNALKMHELYISSRDSILSENNQNEIIRQEYKYDYDKQSLADSLEFVRQQQIGELEHEAELEQEANQRYALYGGIGFLLLLGGVVFRSYQRKIRDNVVISEQKKEVEHQKEMVEVKNQEILDSITYAQRIQEAILPSESMFNELLPNAFVLYKPKDIVAGDYYWLEQKDNKVLFAACDCTGHGVPGAMVSVVCHNAMNRTVNEFGLIDPGEILDKTRELVVDQFEKSVKDVKDGMDIALCALSGTSVEYAGANNPLVIVRNGQIIEVSADKQPIGQIDNVQPFVTHTIDLQTNDSLYIFSDGYADQFGGEKGKKLKGRAFRELLLSVQDKDMQQQCVRINEAFEQWRGELEQVDDVCVIGVRITNVEG